MLESLVARVGPFPGELRIIPELTLNCNALITNIFIGAAYFQPAAASTEVNTLELVIWNCTSRCERLHSATIAREELTQAIDPPSSLYKADVDFQLRLTEAGESFVLGIEQSSSTGVLVYYQQDTGLTNYHRTLGGSATTIALDDASFSPSQALPLLHPVLSKLVYHIVALLFNI